VPVPVTTFAPIATGGTAQQPITSFNYQNIGVNIDITPRTHHDDDVSLNLKIAVTNISGPASAGCRRSATARSTRSSAARRRDQHAGGLDSRRRASRARRHPGLSDIPLIGRMFAHTTKSTEQTDIILTLTPHIIRVLDLTEADLRPFRVGRDSLGPLPSCRCRSAEPPKPPEARSPRTAVEPAAAARNRAAV
jgi:general secretion pathway protein D